MYYPEEVIQQVIEANDIVDVIGQYVSLKKSGSNYMGLCPFHHERTPSFSVSQSKQLYHCFGCGESGNVIGFVMKYENDTFPEALKVLADRAGIKLPEANYTQEQRQKARQRETLLAINKAAATWYFKLLRSPRGKAGMAYFRNRQLSPETMNRFGLGYADGARNDCVAMLRKEGFSDEDILASGVGAFDERRGLHDKFFNRVMFPIMDVTNRVIGFGGRVMGDAKPKYLNSPETPVFDKSRNLYGLYLAKKTKADYFILCEGYMDTIAMHQAGFDMAVASLGTAFTQQQAQILKRYNKRILLDYDSDEAGVKAALRNMNILRSVGIQPKVIDMRPAKDADEFMKTFGRDEYQKRIDNAENSFLYEIRQIEGNYSMDDPDSRTQFYHEIARRLCQFDDDLERDNYTKTMAEKYYIPLATLRKEVASYQLAGANVPGAFVPRAQRNLQNRTPQDRTPQDRTPQDRTPQDRMPQDRMLWDRTTQDRSLQDAQSAYRGGNGSTGRTGFHTSAAAPKAQGKTSANSTNSPGSNSPGSNSSGWNSPDGNLPDSTLPESNSPGGNSPDSNPSDRNSPYRKDEPDFHWEAYQNMIPDGTPDGTPDMMPYGTPDVSPDETQQTQAAYWQDEGGLADNPMNTAAFSGTGSNPQRSNTQRSNPQSSDPHSSSIQGSSAWGSGTRGAIPRIRPKSPDGNQRLTTVEKGLRRNERLLLTWLSDQPTLYLQVKQFVTPEDFEEGVYQKAARKYFSMLEQHFGDPLNQASGITPDGQPADNLSARASISPASVIAIFDDEEDQREAALMFDAHIQGIVSRQEREKALKDVIRSIKQASLNRLMKNSEGRNVLAEITKAKQQLMRIQQTHFTVE